MALGTPVSIGTSAQAGAGLTSAVITTTAAVAAGSALIIAVAFDIAQPNVVVSDSAGNLYGLTADAQAANASGLTVQLYSCLNCKALPIGSTITVSLPGGTVNVNGNLVPVGAPANYLDCAAAAVTGVDFPAALDVTPAATGSGTSPSSGSATSGQVAEVLFGAIGWYRTANPGTTETITWSGSFTALADAQAEFGTTARAGVFLGYRVVASTAAYAAAATLGNSDQWAAVLASYRAESDFAGGEVYVNGVPLTSGRTDLTPSASVNRHELRGVADFDGRLYTDANCSMTLTVVDVNSSTVLNAVAMDERGPGLWGLDVANTVYVHGNGPWAHTLVVSNAGASKVLATYRYSTTDPQT